MSEAYEKLKLIIDPVINGEKTNYAKDILLLLYQEGIAPKYGGDKIESITFSQKENDSRIIVGLKYFKDKEKLDDEFYLFLPGKPPIVFSEKKKWLYNPYIDIPAVFSIICIYLIFLIIIYPNTVASFNKLFVIFERSSSKSRVDEIKPSKIKTKKQETEIPQKNDIAEDVPEEASLEVTKRTIIAPTRDYDESVFYQKGKKIARQKSSEGKILEQTGDVPDGLIKVYNDNDDSYGEEIYKDNKLEGTARIYYKGGRLKSVSEYEKGKLLRIEIYHPNGFVRFKADYSDARDYPGQKEVGVGKVYSNNGILRYEWNVTNTNETAYKKSYNKDGKLTSAIYYDKDGIVIKEELHEK